MGMDAVFFLATLRMVRHRLITLLGHVATHYDPHSPISQIPDIPSPLYPDRPIRPLPKRRLRSRLSPDVADSILYAPGPPESASLFYYPYGYGEVERGNSVREAINTSEHHPACMCGSQNEHVPAETELDSEDDELGARTRPLYLPQPEYHDLNGLHVAQARFAQHGPSVDLPPIQPKPPNSTTSSVDGYDSFENTKNKKKRKIPTPGNASVHQAHLSAELANLEISSRHGPDLSSTDEVASPMGPPYGTAYSMPPSSGGGGGGGNGISGSGSGRLSRNAWRNGTIKSPLGVSSDGLNAWSNGRGARFRPREANGLGNLKAGATYLDHLADRARDGGVGGTGLGKNDAGIIGAAIANAAQGSLKTAAAKDQENVSLLQQQASRKGATSSAQFTFTASSSVTWPGGPTGLGANGHLGGPLPPSVGLGSRGLPGPSQLMREMATQGTQTGSIYAGPRRPVQAPPAPQYLPGPARAPPQQHHPQPAPPPPPLPQQQHQQPLSASMNQATAQAGKKTRSKRNGNQYLLAARERRLQQRYKNYHHPPSGDEIWICEFCEYESIFGAPPEALVRQYEIKDMKERRRLAEKRRLLEKAKMKGRKGKKGGKGATSKSPAAATTPNQQHAPQQPHGAMADPTQLHGQGGPSDGYMRDEFFDEDVSALDSPTPSLPPPPTPPAAAAHVSMASPSNNMALNRTVHGSGGTNKLGGVNGGGGGGGEGIRAN